MRPPPPRRVPGKSTWLAAAAGIAATLPGAKVTVQKVGNGPFKGSPHFVAATRGLQVGETGKQAGAL
ncbi:MAG TPA: hypothetical protein VF475_01775 [Sphingobium sp.]